MPKDRGGGSRGKSQGKSDFQPIEKKREKLNFGGESGGKVNYGEKKME